MTQAICPAWASGSYEKFEQWEKQEAANARAEAAARPPAPPREMVRVKMLVCLAGPRITFKEGTEYDWPIDTAVRMMLANEATPICDKAKKALADAIAGAATPAR